MINFACKQFDLNEVVKCGLGLTKADLKIMKSMLRSSGHWFTTQELAKKLELNITTIQRSAKSLFEKKIIERYQNNLDNGGYIYIYKIKSKTEIVEMIMDRVNAWVEVVGTKLNNW